MKRQLKLVWGTSQAIPEAKWYFGLVGLFEQRGWNRDGLAVSVRAVLCVMLAALPFGYLAGAAALFWFWQGDPYNTLTFTDAFLYPVRRAEIAVKHGEAYNARGIELVRAGRYHEGAMLLRLGLARAPRDVRARIALAQYHLLMNQRPVALRTMQEGLSEGLPVRSYLEALISMAEQGEDYALVTRVCERYLPRLTGDANLRTRRWLSQKQFDALAATEDWTAALACAEAEAPGDMAGEHRILALLALGRVDDAVTFLDVWRAKAGANVELVTRLRVRVSREAKRYDEMERAIAELRALSPADPTPAVFAVVQQAMAGRDAAAWLAFDDFIFRFGGTPENLLRLATALAETRATALLRRTMAAAAERGAPPQAYVLMLARALMQNQEWDAAVPVLATISPKPGDKREVWQVEYDWLRNLIEAGRNPADAAQSALLEFLRGRRFPLPVYRETIAALQRGGRLATAHDVLALGRGSYPGSKWLQAETQQVDAKLAAAASHSTDVADAAQGYVRQTVFFQELDERLHAGKWEEAERQIRDLEKMKPPPPWLQPDDARLRLAQVRICHGNGDDFATLTAARQFLLGAGDRSPQLIEVAQEFFAAGDKVIATKLMDEVLKRMPGNPTAQRLLATWRPPVKKPAEAGGAINLAAKKAPGDSSK